MTPHITITCTLAKQMPDCHDINVRLISGIILQYTPVEHYTQLSSTSQSLQGVSQKNRTRTEICPKFSSRVVLFISKYDTMLSSTSYPSFSFCLQSTVILSQRFRLKCRRAFHDDTEELPDNNKRKLEPSNRVIVKDF